MKELIRFVGSSVIALILISIPGLLVASFAFDWHGFLKTVLCMVTIAEFILITSFIYERSEE